MHTGSPENATRGTDEPFEITTPPDPPKCETTGADRPNRTDDTSRSENDEGGCVIPFQSGGRDGLRQSQVRWVFTTDVRRVGGAKGDWLRHELAGVVGDLLVWACDDMTDGGHDEGEERAEDDRRTQPTSPGSGLAVWPRRVE